VVLLEHVSSEQFPGEELQLQDALGNAWTAAADSLAAAAQAAAAADEAADAVADILPTPVRNLLSAIVAEPTDSSPQQQQQGQPPAKRLRVASGGAVPGPGAAAGAAQQWRLQLQLVQGQRARSADGAAGSRHSQQQQQQRRVVSEVPFDAEGCCRLAAATLESLGIGSTGEYALHAAAVAAGRGPGKQVR
jgi:hypothetical protein